jgi:hypothetical protein
MKIFILATALVATLMLTATTAPASAATKTRVNALFCADAGGQWTIPAGTEVQVALGFFTKRQGLATDFVHAQRTSISIDGGSVIDISGFWSTPEPFFLEPYGDTWLTRVVYDTGVVLGEGATMQFQFVLEERHVLLDGLVFENGVSGKPVLFRPNVYVYDCTVTGV